MTSAELCSGCGRPLDEPAHSGQHEQTGGFGPTAVAVIGIVALVLGLVLAAVLF